MPYLKIKDKDIIISKLKELRKLIALTLKENANKYTGSYMHAQGWFNLYEDDVLVRYWINIVKNDCVEASDKFSSRLSHANELYRYLNELKK